MRSDGPVISPALAGSASTPAVTTCSGASRRASASAVARSHWSAAAGTGVSRSRSALIGRSAVVGSRRRPRSSKPQPAAVLQLVPPRSAGRARSCRAPVGRDHVVARRQHGAVDDEQDVRVGRRSSAPNRAARRGRAAAARRARPGWWRPSGADRPRRSPDRRGRGAATSPSPSGPATSSDASTATARCSGDWNVAAEQIIARASARAPSSGPHTSIRPKARRSTAAGRFGLHPVDGEQPAQGGRRRRVDLVDRARSGGTSSSESGRLHTPYRTWRKSGR